MQTITTPPAGTPDIVAPACARQPLPRSLLAALLGMIAAVLAFAGAGPASADSWLLPSAQEYVSENGRFRLTILPRELRDQLRYFTDLGKRKEHPGQKKGGRTNAVGILDERLPDGRWSALWQAPLVNDVAPVAAVVSNDGQHVVTFDNWHMMGYGRDTLVVYGAEGRALRSLGLSDFLPQDYIQALPRSVSSIHWRDEPYFSGNDLNIPVAYPALGRGGEDDEFVIFTMTLPDGDLGPANAADWDAARQILDAQ